MVIGEYPCCDGPFSMAVPERTPAWTPEECPHCGTDVWHRLSRVDPKSWVATEFETIFNIDFDTRMITPKPGYAENGDQL